MLLSDATKPLLVVSRLVGLNPKTQWYKIYTVFIVICEVSTIYHTWQFWIQLRYNDRVFNIIVHFLEEVCRIIPLLVILGSSLFDRNRFMVPSNEFANIDESLKRLGGRIDNSATYRFQILLLIYLGLILLYFGLVELNTYVVIPDGPMYRISVINWWYSLIILLVCAVADCTFSSTLSVIRKRFEEINLLIRRALKHGSYFEINSIQIQRARTDNHLMGDLRILRIQYHDLWGISNRVNKAYGLHLLVEVMTSLALMTGKLWTGYAAFMNSHWSGPYNVVNCIIWALFYLTRIFLLVKASESTFAEAKATSVVLQELGMEGYHDYATKSEIRDFFTQLQFEVQKFTACGFFDLDFKMIYGILGAVCTYLVILVQMGTAHDFELAAGHSNDSIYLGMKEH